MTDVQVRQITRISSGAELINDLLTSKRLAKEKGNWLTWMVLLVLISYSEHVRRVQKIKTTCNIQKPNSKLGFLICVRFGFIIQCYDLSNLFRRDAVVWSHKSLKTSPLFWKVFRFVTGFLAI